MLLWPKHSNTRHKLNSLGESQCGNKHRPTRIVLGGHVFHELKHPHERGWRDSIHTSRLRQRGGSEEHSDSSCIHNIYTRHQTEYVVSVSLLSPIRYDVSFDT